MRRKIITLSVVVCMIVSMVAYSVLAFNKPFDTNGFHYVDTVKNNYGVTKTLKAKATLSSGSGGVWVLVRNNTGVTIIAQKLFPYQDQSISPLSHSVNATEKRRLYVEPNTSGQTVVGNLNYYFA